MSSMLGQNAEPVRHADQFDEGLRPHFLHRLAAMDLHGHLANLEVGSDLLVESTGDYVSHDLPLPCGQRFEPLPQFGGCRDIVAPGAIPLDPELDRIEELLLAE